MVWLPYLLLGSTAAVAFPFRLPFMAQKPLEAPATTPPTSGLDATLPECHTHVSPPPPVPSSWNCTILAWVRSPDLVPNTIVPADVRISANGVGCKDIVDWSVGLVFKERASSKLKSPNIGPAPKRPRHEDFNHTTATNPQSDMLGGYSPFGGEDPFSQAMIAYYQELQSPLRWKLEGVERPVFDTNLTLEISPESWLDGEWLDSTSSFSVVMPNTNHVWLETLLEYYVMATHRDGSKAYIPAGYTAFTPMQSPTSPIKKHLPESDWPKKLDLVSPRSNSTDVDEPTGETNGSSPDIRFEEGPIAPPAPQCDVGNLAQFHISFAKADTEENIVQGRNTTLNVTVTRAGNGSEYPMFLSFHHVTLNTYPWLINKMDEDDIKSLGVALGAGQTNSRHWSEASQMLMAPDETAQPVKQPRGVIFRGQSPTQYRFKEPKEVYEFQISVPIRRDDVPTFDKSFVSLRSALAFSLKTYFACEPEVETRKERDRLTYGGDPAPRVQSDAEKAALALDSEWAEDYSDKRPPGFARRLKDGRVPRFTHSGIVSLDVLSAATSESELLHYQDEGAQAPVLVQGRVVELDRAITHPPLCFMFRSEAKHELHTSRYAHNHRYPGRIGGQHSYAARMWRTFQRAGQVDEDEEPADDDLGSWIHHMVGLD
ncbi:uncharacterized protein LOC62_05G007554 [Vanrija pseudolonga]|uniref:Uncharacterized protein n=1 Tax=Vanrija pseudolonga TaxID=143232 RepID=A0AAF0YDP0_9TREE|nr:hypothetical protein LOC62_05G007554 [Vanrija pseudolonga]